MEAFQAELIKKLLKWPKHHSNTAAVVVLVVPTMKHRVLERKLGFLMRVMAGNTDSLSGSIQLALCDDESVCLVRECREKEEHFCTHFTSEIIKKETTCNLKEMKKIIIEAYKKMTIKMWGESFYDCQSC